MKGFNVKLKLKLAMTLLAVSFLDINAWSSDRGVEANSDNDTYEMPDGQVGSTAEAIETLGAGAAAAAAVPVFVRDPNADHAEQKRDEEQGKTMLHAREDGE